MKKLEKKSSYNNKILPVATEGTGIRGPTAKCLRHYIHLKICTNFFLLIKSFTVLHTKKIEYPKSYKIM